VRSKWGIGEIKFMESIVKVGVGRKKNFPKIFPWMFGVRTVSINNSFNKVRVRGTCDGFGKGG